MTITCEATAAALVIVLEGELNALSSQNLRSTIEASLAAGTTAFVVDLSAVTFIDSSGLGALVSGLKQAKVNRGNLVLVGLQSQARLIFEITKAYRIFDIFESSTSALEFLAR